ncbi:MAG: hypothetical protein AUJ52_10955 [Elusimicrobia bacterium CG1_02_63_36]|nr:MAG: hypothetical protein AUJ52_10955 [Elusimicrobia bacterium CG1_02_63_36]
MNRLLIAVLLTLPLLFQPSPAAAGPLETLQFGGQIRVRSEHGNPTAGYGAYSLGDVTLIRTRLNISAKPGEGLVGFIQFQDSRTAGQTAPGALPATPTTYLHQGYIDVNDLYALPLHLRAGRFAMDYGGGRLISSLDWSNIGRSWDGVRLQYKRDDWQSDLFATKIVEVAGQALNDDTTFVGLYNTYSGVENHVFDAYALELSSKTAGNADTNRHTLGLRGARNKGNLLYAGELVWQSGRQGGSDIQAWAFAADAAYTFEREYKPQISGEYAYASGDRHPNDKRDQRFQPLFPFGHFYHGFADLQQWSNTHAFKLALAARPCKSTWGQIALHHFRLASRSDGWINAGGAVVGRDPNAASGANVGTELDLHFKTKVRGALGLWYGYSRFFRGAYAKNVLPGKGRDMDWMFAQAVLNF